MQFGVRSYNEIPEYNGRKEQLSLEFLDMSIYWMGTATEETLRHMTEHNGQTSFSEELGDNRTSWASKNSDRESVMESRLSLESWWTRGRLSSVEFSYLKHKNKNTYIFRNGLKRSKTHNWFGCMIRKVAGPCKQAAQSRGQLWSWGETSLIRNKMKNEGLLQMGASLTGTSLLRHTSKSQSQRKTVQASLCRI